MLENTNIVIFGSNGWIGKSLLDFLVNKLQINPKNIFPISSSVQNIELENGKKINCITLQNSLNLQLENVIFFHLAFILRDALKSDNIEEYKNKNLSIREDATRLIQHLKPEKIIYSSSGAIYTRDKEKELYGYLKHEDEKYFSKIAKSISAKILIARIFNIAGPYINKLNSYAISNFLIQALTKNEIKIDAKCDVVRSYIHVFDLIKIMVSWADDKNCDNLTFDSRNIDEIELLELANLIKKSLNLNLTIKKESDPNLIANYYVGNLENQSILTDKYKIKLQSHEDCIRSVFDYIVQRADYIKNNNLIKS